MRQTTINVVLFLSFCISRIDGKVIAGLHNESDTNCLSETIYYEAGNQTEEGKIAVAFVVLNRVEKYGLSVCEVIHQRGQFAFVTNRNLLRKPKNSKQWEDSQFLAWVILANPSVYEDPTSGAIAFRRRNGRTFPKRWQVSKHIGSHIFYRERL